MDFKMVPGNAEAVMFLIIIPILILFCLLLEITFDGPSKNLSNDFCSLWRKKYDEDENKMFGDFWSFFGDCL